VSKSGRRNWVVLHSKVAINMMVKDVARSFISEPIPLLLGAPWSPGRAS